MRIVFTILASFFLAVPTWAETWTTLPSATLSPAETSVTLELPKSETPEAEPVMVDKIRFGIQGATVVMQGLVLTPVQGDPVLLRVPEQLKSGEFSGLIHVPGPALPAKSFTLHYRITQGQGALLTMRVSPN